MTYQSYVDGSPIVPIRFVAFYIVIYSLLLLLLFSQIRFFKKKNKFKVFLLGAVFIKCLFGVYLMFFAGFLLIPKPQIIKQESTNNSLIVSTSWPIEIVFSKPVSRKALSKSIEPPTPGVWTFQDPIYDTHLYRKLVFYPTYSLKPDTSYEISLKNIKNFLQIKRPYSIQLSFQTKKTPEIIKTELVDLKNSNFQISAIKVYLDTPKDASSEFDFELSPFIPLEKYIDQKGLTYTLRPQKELQSGVSYQLKIYKTEQLINLADNKIISRKQEKYESDKVLFSPNVLGVQNFTPSKNNVLVNTPVTILFSEDMNQESVQENIQITPSMNGVYTWFGQKALKFTPEKWEYNTFYTFKILKSAKKMDGQNLDEQITRSFTTIGEVKVIDTFPKNSWSGVDKKDEIKITFDQEVDKKSAQEKISISPNIDYFASWENNTIVLKPRSDLSHSTSYTIFVDKGIKSIYGLDSTKEYKIVFSTKEETFKLDVPATLQKYALSCEAASLKMALRFRGIDVTEDDILTLIGQDPTPKKDSTWGNPYVGFVGNVKGKQMVNGYGVYWEPIKNAANKYTLATSFENWDLQTLTSTLEKNKPVIIWGYAKQGRKTSWNTPSGDNIPAVYDEHSVVVVGFVGSSKNPSYLIVNDPLIGQVYWSKADFEKKWAVFSRSGVVIH